MFTVGPMPHEKNKKTNKQRRKNDKKQKQNKTFFLLNIELPKWWTI